MATTQHDREVAIFGPGHAKSPVGTGSAVQGDRACRPVASGGIGEEAARSEDLKPVSLADVGRWRVVAKPGEGNQLRQVVGWDLPGPAASRSTLGR